jgi:hypothetical protein
VARGVVEANDALSKVLLSPFAVHRDNLRTGVASNSPKHSVVDITFNCP